MKKEPKELLIKKYLPQFCHIRKFRTNRTAEKKKLHPVSQNSRAEITVIATRVLVEQRGLKMFLSLSGSEDNAALIRNAYPNLKMRGPIQN